MPVPLAPDQSAGTASRRWLYTLLRTATAVCAGSMKTGIFALYLHVLDDSLQQPLCPPQKLYSDSSRGLNRTPTLRPEAEIHLVETGPLGSDLDVDDEAGLAEVRRLVAAQRAAAR